MTTAMFKTGMNRAVLNQDFFQTIIYRALGPHTAWAKRWSEEELDSSASILSNISSGDDDEDEDYGANFSPNEPYPSPYSKSATLQTSQLADEPCPMNDMTGHFLYRIDYQQLPKTIHTRYPPSTALSNLSSSSGTLSIATTSRPEAAAQMEEGQLWVVIKSKPIDTALIELTNIMAQLQGGDIAEEYDQVKDLTGFRNSHIREIELAELAWQVGGAMERISTKVYNVLRNDISRYQARCPANRYYSPSERQCREAESIARESSNRGCQSASVGFSGHRGAKGSQFLFGLQLQRAPIRIGKTAEHRVDQLGIADREALQ